MRARREILLSAGAIGSPLILQRSRFGPAQFLQSLGIQVVGDHPVGDNVQEHAKCTLAKLVNVSTYNSSLGPYRMASHALRYTFAKRRPLTSPVERAMPFVKTSPELAFPDASISFLPLAVDLKNMPPRLHKRPGFNFVVKINRPRARGTIRIQGRGGGGKTPYRLPVSADDDDLLKLVAGARMTEQIAAAPALSRYVVDSLGQPEMSTSDEEWGDHLQRGSGIGYHPVRNCRMGRASSSVVGPDLPGHGAQNLRVVDASIKPNIISGDTDAPVITIADKASDLTRNSQ